MRLSENKTIEIQLDYFKGDESSIVELHFDITRNKDHAGLDFRITVWKFFFNIHFYDNRHWDYENEQWYVYKGADNGTMGKDD